jgi:type II secretory pathway component PulC
MLENSSKPLGPEPKTSPVSESLQPPLQPLSLKKTGLPPLLLWGLVIFGFLVASALFAYFSKAGRSKTPDARQATLLSSAGNASFMEVIPSPRAPTAVESAVEQERPLPALALSGILFSDRESLALINGRMVHEGAMIDGAKLEKVSSDRVELSFDGHKIILRSK